jgi:hypothetical protein
MYVEDAKHCEGDYSIDYILIHHLCNKQVHSIIVVRSIKHLSRIREGKNICLHE